VGRGEPKQTRPPGRRPASAGSALPAWLEPELATLTRDRFSDPEWIFERKLDGERCLAFAPGPDHGGEVRLMTRNQHQVNSTFPEIAEALAAQQRQAFVVDGEIVAFDGSQTRFERLQQRLGVARPGKELLADVPVYFYLFDVLYADGRDVRPLPLRDRKEVLRTVLDFDDPLRYLDHRDADGEAYYREACGNGWEGLIAKRADAPYRGGRSRDWLKFKCENAQEFVIGGFTDPHGSRPGFGALLLGYYDQEGRLAYAGKVGTGFDQKLLHSLHDSMIALERDSPAFDAGLLARSPERGIAGQRGVHWIEPRLVGQVAFTEWTRDGQLRHPRFQGLREDKDPADVVREIPADAGPGS
jgi:bifunctional non-homologous end joining protein LigD